MDVFTHAVVGALAVQALAPARHMGTGTRIAAAVGAAVFPDLDYLLFWLDPFQFHMEWHRGPTHSLVLLPVWALLLAVLARVATRGRVRWRDGILVSAVALASHVATDLITAYGIQLLYPLSDRRFALDLVFVIDPWFTFLALAGLGLSLLRGPPWAWAGIAALVLYMGALLVLKGQALEAGHARPAASDPGATVHAYPQPLSPLNWLVVVTREGGYELARIHLGGSGVRVADLLPLSELRELSRAFRPRGAWQWWQAPRHGDEPRHRTLAEGLWEADALAPLRRFAYHPVVYRVDASSERLCVWYTDLVFTLPGQVPPFRYGLCGDPVTGPWALARLPMFGHGAPLPW